MFPLSPNFTTLYSVCFFIVPIVALLPSLCYVLYYTDAVFFSYYSN